MRTCKKIAVVDRVVKKKRDFRSKPLRGPPAVPPHDPAVPPAATAPAQSRSAQLMPQGERPQDYDAIRNLVVRVERFELFNMHKQHMGA